MFAKRAAERADAGRRAVEGCVAALGFALLASGCGRVDRSIGNIAPELAAAGAGANGEPSAGTTGKAGIPTDAGAAGATAGGVVTAPGSPLDLGEPWRSAGCGQPLPSEQVPTVPGTRTGYTEFYVNETGATLAEDERLHAGERQFFVRVPADYDPQNAYRVVYIGSGCGVTHGGATATYPLFDEAQGGSEQAIYVGLSVPDNDANPGCYDDTSGPLSQEWEAFDLIQAFLDERYCVDDNRIYIAGYNPGGALANMWGCYFGGLPSPPLDEVDLASGLSQRKFSPQRAVRGGARVGAFLPANQPVPCNGPSAGFWLHDVTDAANPIQSDIAALDLALETNGCQGDYQNGPKETWGPAAAIPGLAGETCQQYTGCPPDVAKNYPLVFCTTTGQGHSDQRASLIPALTAFLELMAPTP